MPSLTRYHKKIFLKEWKLFSIFQTGTCWHKKWMHALLFVITNTEQSLFFVQNGGGGTGKRSETINEILKDNTNFQRSIFFKRGYINTIQKGRFWGCSRMRWEVGRKAPLPKICHTYSKIMKLSSYTLPKEDPKNIWIVWHTSRNTDKDCILIHNF